MIAGDGPVPRLVARLLVAAAVVAGAGLIIGQAREYSATYDESTYLRIADEYRRTGRQDRIARMGSPATFWKLQISPLLGLLSRAGDGRVEDVERSQATLLPYARIACIWIWAAGLLGTAWWAWRAHGPLASAAAAWMFALSPNVLAHASLVTMESPIVALTAWIFGVYAAYLASGRSWLLMATGVLCGIAFSCKFTAVLYPPILIAAAAVVRLRDTERPLAVAGRSLCEFAVLGGLLIASDLVVTGLALIPASERVGEHPTLAGLPGGRVLGRLLESPLPQDWVAFARQVGHQRSGGPSYLLGERSERGWWYYYPVALAVKLPLGVLWILTVRLALATRRRATPDDAFAFAAVCAFLAFVLVGSGRQYGIRYLLPMAPIAIVACSSLATAGRVPRVALLVGLIGQATAVARSHPHELSFFNALAGGPVAGRKILADSNLDWGQGLRELARWQREDTSRRDLTLYYFGDTDPTHWGVIGKARVINADREHPDLPKFLEAKTRFIAVSASLQYGPWGPDGYFALVDGVRPAYITPDGTLTIYESAEVRRLRAPVR